MKPGQAIRLKSRSEESKKILKRAEESGLAERVKKLNDERCRIAGINSPQRQPLPDPFESLRAFFLRLKERQGGTKK